MAGVTDVGLKPRPIRRLAIIGGGLRGSGIATASLLSGIEVVLKEVNQQFLDVSRCFWHTASRVCAALERMYSLLPWGLWAAQDLLRGATACLGDKGSEGDGC